MSRYMFQKSIALTLGAAIVSTGLFVGISSQAQSGTPGTTPTTTPTTTPATTTPGTTTTPSNGGSMTNPGGMTKPATTPAKAPTGKTIVSIAAGNKNFTKLVEALKAADLVDTLAGEGPFTVFAPTNAAFAKIPKEQLKKVLTYHVVSGAVTSNLLKSGQKVATVEGGSLTVKIKGKKVTINNANVILADVKASNGVIHAIDTVLMPGK
jgi:uncharacterized surface protein with fasciclin (FAS1) repeats